MEDVHPGGWSGRVGGAQVATDDAEEVAVCFTALIVEGLRACEDVGFKRRKQLAALGSPGPGVRGGGRQFPSSSCRRGGDDAPQPVELSVKA